MLTKNYNPKSFKTLNEFEESKKLLKENHHLIDELGDVIRKYDLEDKIGICLLHKHFNLTDEEILVETILQEEIKIKPEKIESMNDVVPYMWRLVGLETGNYEWAPLEFVKKNSISADVIKFTENFHAYSEFLSEVTVKLLSLGLTSVFGIALHHRSKVNFDRKEKILLETENEITREMVMKPTDRSEADIIEWTQTLWRFPKKSTMVVESLCDLHGCAGHCSSHSGGPNDGS